MSFSLSYRYMYIYFFLSFSPVYIFFSLCYRYIYFRKARIMEGNLQKKLSYALQVYIYIYIYIFLSHLSYRIFIYIYIYIIFLSICLTGIFCSSFRMEIYIYIYTGILSWQLHKTATALYQRALLKGWDRTGYMEKPDFKQSGFDEWLQNRGNMKYQR